MVSDDSDERHDQASADLSGGEPIPAEPRQEAVSTTDPAIASGSASRREPAPPDKTIVTETTQVQGGKPLPAPSPAATGAAGPRQSANHGEGKARPDRPDRPAWIRYVATGLVALACGAGGGWAYSHFAGPNNRPTGDVASKQGGDPSKEGDPSAPPTKDQGGGSPKADEASSGVGDDLKDQVQHLASRFDVLRQRVEAMAMPRDANPPDLATLRVRMDEFARSTDDLKALPSRLHELEDRLARLQVEVQRLGDQAGRASKGLAAGSPAAGPVAEPAPPPPPPSSPGPPPSADLKPTDETMSAGIALFKKGKYPEAEAIFRRLQATRPEDARVWYYSALASGFASGRWDGEARSFVIRGAERERAGLPAASEIDSAFAHLGPAAGKDWLASYRAQLVKR